MLNYGQNIQQVRDEIGTEPDTNLIVKVKQEKVKVTEGPTQILTKDVSDDYIWGRDNWGEAYWDDSYTNSFSVQGVTNPKNRFIDRFVNTDFKDTTYTTADWNVSTNVCDFTASEVLQTTSIFLNNQNILSATPKCTEESGTLSYRLSRDGGDTWVTASNNTKCTFKQTDLDYHYTTINGEEDLWLRLDETSGTTATDASSSANDGTYQQDASNLTTTGAVTNAITFNGVSGDRAECKRYLLNDDAASTTVVNDAVGSDGTSVQNTNLMSSLVGWWKFEETSGTTVTDSSSNGNDGTANVDISNLTTTGKINNAFSFSGVGGAGNYINLGDNTDFEFGANDFTILAWVYWDGTYPSTIFSKYTASPGNREMTFAVASSGRLMLQTSSDGNSMTTEYSTTTVPINTWTFVAVSRNGSSAALYVNTTPTTVSSVATIISGSSNAYIGAVVSSTTSPDHEFNGKIDELMVFKRAFSSTEIELVHNSGSGVSENISEQSPMESKALYFNGSTDIIRLGDIGSPGTVFSAEAWVKIDELTGDTQNIIINGDNDCFGRGSNSYRRSQYSCCCCFAIWQHKPNSAERYGFSSRNS